MNFKEFLTETVLWEGKIGDEEYSFVIKEGMATFMKPTVGGLVGGLTDKVLSNPVLAGIAAGYAYDAYKKYEKNKKYTARLFAKTSEERVLFSKIVQELMKTGKYKKVKEEYADGGYIYVLKRTDM